MRLEVTSILCSGCRKPVTLSGNQYEPGDQMPTTGRIFDPLHPECVFTPVGQEAIERGTAWIGSRADDAV